MAIKWLHYTKFKLTSSLLLLVTLPFASNGQSLEAYLDHAVFQNASGKPYLELYIQLPANSLHLQQSNGNTFSGTANISMQLTRKDETKPAFEKSYKMKTPELRDTAEANFYLTDLEQISVPKDGHYKLNLTIKDQNEPKSQITIDKSIPMFFPEKQTSISGLQLADTLYYSDTRTEFTKSNYQLFPNASHLVGANQESLYCYAEIYNASSHLSPDDTVNLRFEIRKAEGGKADHFTAYKKPVKPRISLIAKIQTQDLAIGKHHITLKVLDGEGKFLASKQTKILKTGNRKDSSDKRGMDTAAFRKLVKSYDRDTLVKYVNWLDPIADRKAGKTTQKMFAGDTVLSEVQGFFIEFWERRDSVYPNKKWQQYKTEVERVNHHFSSELYDGYETDRGRVYLQYGPPNTIYRSRDDPNFRPYQIWHYFSADNQSNVKFVFFSRSFLEEDFVLLHSNAFGELQNPRWKKRLQRTNHDDPFGNKPEFDFIK